MPNFFVRAREFEECTGGKIMFSEAANLWLDPLEAAWRGDLSCFEGHLSHLSPEPKDLKAGGVRSRLPFHR